MDIESLASVGVLAANGIFVIVSVAGYLRMNAHEQRRQFFVAQALSESREAGVLLRKAALDLMRMIERAERAVAWQRQALQSEAGAAGASGALDEAEPDVERLRSPESLQGLSPQAYAEWRRLHQVELDRVLNQRRRLQLELEALRARGKESPQQRGQLRELQAQLQEAERGLAEAEALREQLSALKGELQRSLIEKDFIEDRLLALDAQERALRPAPATEGA